MSAGDATAPQETVDRADTSLAAASPAPEDTPTSPKAGAYDELLCTICGLTSCWQSPKYARSEP